MPERLYTAYQVATLLGVGEGDVTQWIQKGWLETHRLADQSLRIRGRGLIQFLRKQGVDVEALFAQVLQDNEDLEMPAGRPAAPAPKPFDPAMEFPDPFAPSKPVAPAPKNNGQSPDRAEDGAQVKHAASHAAQRLHPLVDSAPAPAAPTSEMVPAAPPAADIPSNTAQQVLGAIVEDALVRGASELILDLSDSALSLRLRAGGIVYEKPNFRQRLPEGLAPRIIEHVRSLAGLDPAARDTRVGKFELAIADQTLSLLLSCCPTARGQRLVLQVPSAGPAVVAMANLGLPTPDQQRLDAMLACPGGLFLVAGPRGSGKSSVLSALAAELAPSQDVACLQRRNRALAGGVSSIVFSQQPAFDEAFDALVAQRCDAILLDELRHPSTFAQVLAAALDGPKVLAALQARDASDALHLLELAMGTSISRWDLALALLGVLTCRVARALCPHCRKEIQPSDWLLDRLGLAHVKLGFATYRAEGCPECSRTGFAGQEGFYSLLAIEGTAADLLRTGSDLKTIEQAAAKSGARSLLQAGLDKVRAGTVSLDEIARVLEL